MALSLLPALTVMTLAAAGAGKAATTPAGMAAQAQQKPVGYRADNCKLAPAGQGRKLTCVGNVKLWREDLSLACQKLTADFDPQGNLTTAHCTGAVKVVSKDGVAQANEARFDNASGQAVLTGKPRAQQLGSVLEGQLIRLDVKTGDVSVEGGVTGVIVPGATP